MDPYSIYVKTQPLPILVHIWTQTLTNKFETWLREKKKNRIVQHKYPWQLCKTKYDIEFYEFKIEQVAAAFEKMRMICITKLCSSIQVEYI